MHTAITLRSVNEIFYEEFQVAKALGGLAKYPIAGRLLQVALLSFDENRQKNKTVPSLRNSPI
ncbi:MAG: hypothetical protein ABIL39_00200 [candidate division WOR-3 bacterium]